MTGLRAAYSTAGPKKFYDAINKAVCVTSLRRTKSQTKKAA